MQADLIDCSAEGGVNIGYKQRFSSQRYEHVVIERGIGPPPLEVALESGLCSFMQGYKATLAEFGASNHQTIWGDVFKA
jgi:hypothetical protein